jgi:ubiquitin C-terminal hydrolase
MFAFGNLGNTCYMNTALQCLMRLPPLNALLDSWQNPNATPVQRFVKEYNDLRVMATGNDGCCIKPGRFRQAVQVYSKEKGLDFASNEQHDAVEFLQFMLNCLHEALAAPIDIPPEPNDDDIAKKCRDMMRLNFGKEYSAILELFYGVHVSTIGDSHTPEVFSTLDLPIPATASTLPECVQSYMAKDEVQWTNEKTNAVETATKQLSFWRMPPLLIVALKRFNERGQKNAAVVDIPEQITISGTEYRLRCAVLHNGGTHSGHYAACAVVHNVWTILDDDSNYPLDSFKQTYCAIYEIK